MRPRPNLEVNRYFIFDHRRMHYKWMNRGDRIEAPLIRAGSELKAVDWDEAFARVQAILRGASGGGNAAALVAPGAAGGAGPERASPWRWCRPEHRAKPSPRPSGCCRGSVGPAHSRS